MSDKGEYFLILPQLTRERAKEIADEAYSGSLMWHENKAYPYDNECAAIITKENPEIQLSQCKREGDKCEIAIEEALASLDAGMILGAKETLKEALKNENPTT